MQCLQFLYDKWELSLAILCVGFCALKLICSVSDLFCLCQFLFMHLLNCYQLPRHCRGFSAESVRKFIARPDFFFFPKWQFCFLIGNYVLLTGRGIFYSFSYEVLVVLFVENCTSPNQTSSQDLGQMDLAGGARSGPEPRPWHGCSKAQAGVKGEGLSINCPWRKGRLLTALLTALLFSQHSHWRSHNRTIACLALSTCSQTHRRQLGVLGARDWALRGSGSLHLLKNYRLCYYWQNNPSHVAQQLVFVFFPVRVHYKCYYFICISS